MDGTFALCILQLRRKGFFTFYILTVQWLMQDKNYFGTLQFLLRAVDRSYKEQSLKS